jgi:hypothetical protein
MELEDTRQFEVPVVERVLVNRCFEFDGRCIPPLFFPALVKLCIIVRSFFLARRIATNVAKLPEQSGELKKGHQSVRVA